MDAAEPERAVILGGADGGRVAIVFAAAHPERTRALAVFSVTASARQRDGHPWGVVLSDVGDQRWRDVLGTHEVRARAAAERAGGRIVKTTGDGMLVCFDGAAHAVRCAQAIVAEGKRLGLGVRAGVHAGARRGAGRSRGGTGDRYGARDGRGKRARVR